MLAAIATIAWTNAQAAPLDDFRWRKRVLVIFGSGEEADRQVQQLLARPSELAERELLVIATDRVARLVFGEPSSDLPDANALLRTLGVSSNMSFQAVLVGLDGGVKWRSESVTAPERIFDVIDAMPMRRADR